VRRHLVDDPQVAKPRGPIGDAEVGRRLGDGGRERGAGQRQQLGTVDDPAGAGNLPNPFHIGAAQAGGGEVQARRRFLVF